MNKARSRPMCTDSPPRRVVPVLVPTPAPGPYSYLVPDGLSLRPGDIVEVPLGPRPVIGLVWDGGTSPVDPGKLRAVRRKFDCPPLDAAMRRFIAWIADYTLSP